MRHTFEELIMNQTMNSPHWIKRARVLALALLFTGLLAGPAAAGADPAEISKLQSKLRTEYRAAKYKDAMETAKKLHDLVPDDADTIYNIACLHCLLGEKGEAYEWLEKSIRVGYRDADNLMSDADFRTIRGEDRFRKIVADLRADGSGHADEQEKPAAKKDDKPAKKADASDKDEKQVEEMSPRDRAMRINELTRRLIQAAGEKNYDQALEIALKAEELAQKDMNAATKALTAYNVACMQSLMKHGDEAIEAFERAVHTGGFNENLIEQMKDDSDLDFIRKNKRFIRLAEELTKSAAKKVEPATKVTLPKHFDKSKKAPLIVALHPWGGNMNETRDRWQKVADQMGAILLTPQGTYQLGDEEYRWDMSLDDLEDQVMRAVESVMDQYKVDEEKVAIVGFSQGAWAAYLIGIRNAGMIRGVISIAGKFDKSFEAEVDGEDLGDMRCVIMVGDRDDQEMLESSRLAEKVLKKSGATVRYKSYKGLGHQYPKAAEKELTEAVEFVFE